jgi:Ca2+-binding EF-hand superfamily protein
LIYNLKISHLLLKMADFKAVIAKHFEPIFKAYDKDNNSTLEKEELRALLADNLGVNENAITQEQLDWHFGKIDADKDGKISFNEYVNIFIIN